MDLLRGACHRRRFAPNPLARNDGEGVLRISQSCPGLTRASTPFFTVCPKTWMAGTSPAMTVRELVVPMLRQR